MKFERSLLILIAVVLVLSLAGDFWPERHTSDNDHREFFRDMREFKARTERFMNAGERNTAEDGKKRDKRLKRLERQMKEVRKQ